MKTKMPSRSTLMYFVLYMLAVLALEFTFARLVYFSVIPLFIGGFILWWITTRRVQIDPRTIIIPYLLTIIAFIGHVYEEYRAFVLGYPSVLDAIVDLDLNTLLSHAAFLSPILWIASAVMLLKRWSLGYFGVSVFLFGMMFMEPTHFLAPFMEDGTFHYVGGMWTALIPAALGWYTFLVIRRQVKKEQ